MSCYVIKEVAAPRASLTLPSCSPNYPRASRIGWTLARYCPFLNDRSCIWTKTKCSIKKHLSAQHVINLCLLGGKGGGLPLTNKANIFIAWWYFFGVYPPQENCLSFFFIKCLLTYSIFPALADSIKSIKKKVLGVRVCVRLCTALCADLFQGNF